MPLLHPPRATRIIGLLSLVLAAGCATGEELSERPWTSGTGGAAGEAGSGGATGGAGGVTGGSGGGETGGTGGETGGTGGETGGTGGVSGTGGTGGAETGGTGGTGGATGGTGGATGGTGGATGGTGGATGGTGGATGGTGGATGGTGGTPTPTCDDGIQNQGETGVDCGGPCPACPTCSDGIQNQGETGVDCGGPCAACVVGFTHQENFNSFPTWGPDGQYQVSGTCNGDSTVDGWGLTNYVASSFPQATGYYAIIDTDDLSYLGLACDDYMMTPALAAAGATSITIDFDMDFDVFTSSTATVFVERDGAMQSVWTRSTDAPGQHVTIGPVDITGTTTLRVLWHYSGTYEYHWMVDNIVVVGS